MPLLIFGPDNVGVFAKTRFPAPVWFDVTRFVPPLMLRAEAPVPMLTAVDDALNAAFELPL
jgi:hypothetical protein